MKLQCWTKGKTKVNTPEKKDGYLARWLFYRAFHSALRSVFSTCAGEHGWPWGQHFPSDHTCLGGRWGDWGLNPGSSNRATSPGPPFLKTGSHKVPLAGCELEVLLRQLPRVLGLQACASLPGIAKHCVSYMWLRKFTISIWRGKKKKKQLCKLPTFSQNLAHFHVQYGHSQSEFILFIY